MPHATPAPVEDATLPTHLGVIQARGPDAADFLHSQLTQDMLHLGAGQARLAAYLSPKGRVLASFLVLRTDPQEFLLVCHRSVLASTLKRLALFTLHAQLTLHDATEGMQLLGLLGGTAQSLLPAGANPGLCQTLGSAHAVALHPADGCMRALWLAPAGKPPPAAPAGDAAQWLWSEVRSGVVTISQPVANAFVPQMLNLESVGAVDFHKGCYPGQEVVARSQFRGSVKRRTYLAHSQGALAVGDTIFRAEDSVGTVVQAAPSPHGGHAALVVLPIDGTEGELRTAPSNGALLQIKPLPYTLAAGL
ncbi:MAG: hypothetical protein BGO13_05225 [Burkholderiales bacterium 66-5]|uniref:CAF17-like 4Fe-4S cluster assembly/insertion protein YgfZ n=1 Tax=Comamonas badia TaxID=265291 RepID=UPI000466698E|nr:folate-binding protein YgfZ [Comamonas badia]OJU89571.1 MAG: hypothetical protein BGO13_05225 [Burkholderiales bacterium 66-5]